MKKIVLCVMLALAVSACSALSDKDHKVVREVADTVIVLDEVEGEWDVK